jgi:hypothetical protein
MQEQPCHLVTVLCDTHKENILREAVYYLPVDRILEPGVQSPYFVVATEVWLC